MEINNNGKMSDQELLDLYLSGNSFNSYEYMGAHKTFMFGRDGVVFRVWAPNAKSISVVGDFNSWNRNSNPMGKISDAGVWECFISEIKQYDIYKYSIETGWGEIILKSDPYAFHAETRPNNASRYFDLDGFTWSDDEWQEKKQKPIDINTPINVYEVHAGSWRKYSDGNVMSYRKLADELIPYAKEMGYTHIEFMPITEYPYDGSWGYQVTGYYAPTSRYGNPHDFMEFVDTAHKNGIGVILDWVPAHFPRDGYGLARFDGTACYEYENWKKGEHKEWGTLVFNYSRYEVKSFLLSSAMFWLKKYHVDGIRVDAVASMLYLDYNRKDGEWEANMFGGKEHLEAVDFLKQLNWLVAHEVPGAMMIAEESTSWPMVSRPTEQNGLGFTFKWNMGWMNDMMRYMSLDPLYRPYNHDNLTFSLIYAFSENFMLPISHDEVVYGKGSLINKMPGDYDQKFAGVRAFLAYMMAHPGKKLTFMGSEFGQFNEWNFEKQLDWEVLQYPRHQELQRFVKEINKFYKENSQLWDIDFTWDGFRWISLDDFSQSVIAFRRLNREGKELIVVCNFQPMLREHYRIGVPFNGKYAEVFNSDDLKYGGRGITNGTDIIADTTIPMHSCEQSIEITLPPMSVMYFECVEKVQPVKEEKPVEETAPVEEAVVVEEAPVEKPKRTRKSTKKADVEETTSEEAPAEKPKRGRKPAKKAETEAVAAEEVPAEKPKRTRKSTKKTESEEVASVEEAPAEKPKRSRKSTKKTAEPEVTAEDIKTEAEIEVKPETVEKKTTAKKTTKKSTAKK
ncbi:MAG: 1,4-alpha-glucan branching protein GlgB [Acutalibacteraceae bacterium]